MITLFISDSVSDLIKYFALFMNYLMNDLPYHKENPLNRTVNTESTSIRQKEKGKKKHITAFFPESTRRTKLNHHDGASVAPWLMPTQVSLPT